MRASTQEVTKPFAYDFEVSLYPTHIPKSPSRGGQKSSDDYAYLGVA